MGFTLTATDEKRLSEIEPALARVIRRAAALSPIPFRVLEGRRTLARQKKLVAEGRSRTEHSLHLTGRAVDIAPLVRGRVTWAWPAYARLAPIIKDAARLEGVPIQWGGDWRTFRDGPHWQLRAGA